jgi:hypothetical protein
MTSVCGGSPPLGISDCFKSGPRKGGFSTARTLLRCDQLLRDLVERVK